MFLNTLILLSLIVPVYLYWFYKKRFSHFEKRNIAFVKPTLVFGNIKEAAFRKKPLVEVHKDIYRKLKPRKICGYFNFHRPVLLICDPELIKNIIVKDFAYFSDRYSSAGTGRDSVTNNLATSTGKEWRNLRIKLTPTFTSGKIKNMFPLMKVSGNNLHRVLNKSTSEGDIAFNNLCERFTMDIMATCVLGLETNCLENPDSELLMYHKNLYRNEYILKLPTKITQLIESTKTKRFFYSLVLDTIKYRETNNVIRNDFLDLLIELKKNSVANNLQNNLDAIDLNKSQTEIGNKDDKFDLEITDDLLVAQVVTFVLTGYATVSKALSFALLELALNPDVQDKVRKEITSILRNNGDEFTYEAMKQMKYTDMVISETLRKHPPASVLMRTCTRTYVIPGTEIVINKDDNLVIPTYSLHTDKQYYDRPDEFCPEHFTKEAIASRPHYTYLPFGEGRRMCVATRFSLMNVKVGLVYMLKNFSYIVSSKTKLPLRYCTGLNNLIAVEGGIWLKRNKI